MLFLWLFSQGQTCFTYSKLSTFEYRHCTWVVTAMSAVWSCIASLNTLNNSLNSCSNNNYFIQQSEVTDSQVTFCNVRTNYICIYNTQYYCYPLFPLSLIMFYSHSTRVSKAVTRRTSQSTWMLMMRMTCQLTMMMMWVFLNPPKSAVFFFIAMCTPADYSYQNIHTNFSNHICSTSFLSLYMLIMVIVCQNVAIIQFQLEQ